MLTVHFSQVNHKLQQHHFSDRLSTLATCFWPIRCSVVSFDVRVRTSAKKSPPVTWDPLTLSVKLGAESCGPGD